MGWSGREGRQLGNDDRRDRLRAEWATGLKMMVLSKAEEGYSGGMRTKGAERAASMLADYGWADRTWENRVSQLRKWVTFCDDEGRQMLPASEGDVLSYIGWLSIEGRVGSASAPQYVSAVSRFHEDAGYPSPTRTRLVARMLKS